MHFRSVLYVLGNLLMLLGVAAYGLPKELYRSRGFKFLREQQVVGYTFLHIGAERIATPERRG